MDYDGLQMFLELSRSLHFLRASRACHVSPSTLSRVVQRLEQETGAVLFERDRRSVRLTAEGQFRTCLFALDETDLRAELRADGALAAPDLDDRLVAKIERAVAGKWAGHRIGQVDFIRPARSMSQIGG